MDFLDKLGKTASKTYKYTTEKTSRLAKETKLKMSMNDKKAKIDNIYTEIGRKVYEKHVKYKDLDMDLEQILEEYCLQIDKIANKIEEERKEILNLRKKKQCPNCFYEIEINYQYCPNCGAVQDEIELEENILDKQKDLENIQF